MGSTAKIAISSIFFLVAGLIPCIGLCEPQGVEVSAHFVQSFEKGGEEDLAWDVRGDLNIPGAEFLGVNGGLWLRGGEKVFDINLKFNIFEPMFGSQEGALNFNILPTLGYRWVFSNEIQAKGCFGLLIRLMGYPGPFESNASVSFPVAFSKGEKENHDLTVYGFGFSYRAGLKSPLRINVSYKLLKSNDPDQFMKSYGGIQVGLSYKY